MREQNFNPLDDILLDSNYSFETREQRGQRTPQRMYRTPVPSLLQTKSSDQVFLDAMYGTGNEGAFGNPGNSFSAPSASASQDLGFLSGEEGEENGFTTTVGDLSVANIGNSSYGSGIGGLIGMATDAIGMLGGLLGGDDSDASSDSGGYDSNGLGQGSADSAAGVGDSAGSGDGQGDAGSGSGDSGDGDGGDGSDGGNGGSY